MHDPPYDPAKFFDPENAAKAPKTGGLRVTYLVGWRGQPAT